LGVRPRATIGDSGLRTLLPVYCFLLLMGFPWTASINGPLLPLYVRSLGIEVTAWSVLIVSSWAGIALSEWVGWSTERIGNPQLQPRSLAWAYCFPYTPLATQFLILRFFSSYQVFAATMGPVTRSVVSCSAPAKLLGLSMSLWRVFVTLGKVLGPLGGSYMSQVSSFRNSFYLSSILCVMVQLPSRSCFVGNAS